MVTPLKRTNDGSLANVATGDTIDLPGDLHSDATASDRNIGSSGLGFHDLYLNKPAVGASLGSAVPLSSTAVGSSGSKLVGVDTSNLTNSAPANGSLQTVLEALDAMGGGGGGSLQDAYGVGNTVSVTSADGTVSLTNATDTTDVLTVGRTFSGAGRSLVVSTGAFVTGPAVLLNNAGSGNALQVQDGGGDVLVVDGAGKVTVSPTSGQNFAVTVGGAGTAAITAASNVDFTSSAGAVAVDSAQGVSLRLSASPHLEVTSVGSVSVTPSLGQDFSATVDSGAITFNSTAGGNVSLNAAAGGSTSVSTTRTSAGSGGDVTISTVGVNGGATAGNVVIKSNQQSGGTAGGIVISAGSSLVPMAAASSVYLNSYAGTEIQYQASARIAVTDNIQNTPATNSDWSAACTGTGSVGLTAETGTIIVAGASAAGTGDILDVYTSTTTGTAGAAGFRSRALSSGGTSGSVTVGTTAAAGATASTVALGSAAVGNGTSGDVEIVTTAGSSGTVGDILVGSFGANAAVRGGVSIRTGTAAPSVPSADEILIVANNGGNTAAITFQARGGASIGLNSTSDPSLVGFTATSIVGALNELKASSGTGVTLTRLIENGVTLAAGDAVAVSATSNQVRKADASTANNCNVLGVCLTGGTGDGNTVNAVVALAGVVTGLSGLTANRPVFLSDSTSGLLTTTVPSAAGSFSIRMGFSLTTTSMVIHIGEKIQL